MSDRPRSFDRNTLLAERIWWLIGGRLAAAVVLILVAALWHGGVFGSSNRSLWGVALPVFVSVVIVSLCYGLALRFSNRYHLQASIQSLIDVLLVTWLVWASGDVSSPFTVLYIITIAVTSIVLGPRAAVIASFACAAVFTGLTVPIVVELIPRAAGYRGATIPLTSVVQAIGLNDVAFLIVGLLVAKLADRQSRSDVQLMATTQSLASLRALHERIVESIRSGLVTTDFDGCIYTFNAAAEEITGFKAEDMVGQDASKLFGDISSQIEDSLRAASESEISPRFETDIKTPEELRLRIGFGVAPLFAESGEISGLVITFQDLTDVRAMEETARRQDRLAAVGRVAASIAHEIRNPLAAMSGAIQVLKEDLAQDSSQAELMDIILRESDRLNKIITDFLTYSRPRLTDFHPVDIREGLRETFVLMRHSPELSEAHTLAEIIPDEPCVANADAAQIKQVFWNLSRNALQAMPDGGKLTVELTRRKNGRLQILFTDTGAGMSPQQVERLFEPFTSTRVGGTGLGLSIVYQIVRDHGGTINVRSLVGQGTTITIELPGASVSHGKSAENGRLSAASG